MTQFFYWGLEQSEMVVFADLQILLLSLTYVLASFFVLPSFSLKYPTWVALGTSAFA